MAAASKMLGEVVLLLVVVTSVVHRLQPINFIPDRLRGLNLSHTEYSIFACEG